MQKRLYLGQNALECASIPSSLCSTCLRAVPISNGFGLGISVGKWLGFIGLTGLLLIGAFTVEAQQSQRENELSDSLRKTLNKIILNQPDSAQSLALKLLREAKTQGDTRKLFDALGFLGLIAGVTNNTEEALAYFHQQYLLFEEVEDLKAKATVLMHLGNVFNYREELDSAAYYWFQALHLFEQLQAYDGIAGCYNNIGLVYEKREDWETARSYYNQSLQLRQAHGPEQKLGYSYNRLGNVYFHEKDYPLAKAYYQKYLDHSRAFQLEREEANALSNLGNVAKAEGNLAKAITHYQQALALFEKQNARYFIAYLHNNLAEAYLEKAGVAQALFHSAAALKTAEAIRHLELQKRAAELKANAAALKGDFKQAWQAATLAKTLADSLMQKEQLEKFARLEARYRAERAQKQLAEKQLALQKETTLKYYIIWGGLALFSFLSITFLYLRNRDAIKRHAAELQARLNKAEANKLRELNDFKSRFIANISHEFKTPLTLILSSLEEEQLEKAPEKNRQIIQHHTRRLLQLIQRLLQLAKLESGNFTPQPSRGPLSLHLKKWAEEFEPLAEQEHIQLQIDLPDDFVQDYFDAEIVQTILANLLSNAIKFCQTGDLITLGMERRPPFVQLSVEDTGPGIQADKLPYLFQRFSPTKYSSLQAGSGLGLALAKELAQAHGGDILLETQIGKGSCFYVNLRTDRAFFEQLETLLPKEETLPSKQEREQELREKLLPSLQEQRPLLLIAEDDEELRNWLAGNLQNEYHILQAADGREALQKIQEQLPDFILLDVSMPLIDGYALCRQIKSDTHCSHIPVIMLTAHDSEAEKLRGLSCGATAYLTKPFYLEEVRIRLANLLEERQRMQEKLQKELIPFSSQPLQAHTREKSFLLRLRKAIEQHISDDRFGVSQLASEMLLSRSQLHRKIKALTGCAPNELIRKMRLLYAFELLKEKRGSISEIAYQCGFSSPTYFSTCFKEQFGYSPRELHNT